MDQEIKGPAVRKFAKIGIGKTTAQIANRVDAVAPAAQVGDTGKGTWGDIGHPQTKADILVLFYLYSDSPSSRNAGKQRLRRACQVLRREIRPNRLLEGVDIEIERAEPTLMGDLAVGADQIKPVRPGDVFFLGVVIHAIQQHWK